MSLLPLGPTLTRGQQFELRCLNSYSHNSTMPYLSMRDGEVLVKLTQHSNWKPQDPPTLFGKGFLTVLRFILERMLRAAQSSKKYRLEFYSAVNSPLDIHHGVDAFVSLVDIDVGHTFIVSLDLTLNPGKVTGKADFIIDEKDADFLERIASSNMNFSKDFCEPLTSVEKKSYEKIEEIIKFLWAYWYHFNEILKNKRSQSNAVS